MTTDRVMFRRGTAVQWTQANPVLAAGEPGYETDTHRLKIGDGVRRWADLHYILLDYRLFTTKVAFGSTAPVAPAPGSVWIHSTDGTFPDIPPPPTPQAFTGSAVLSGTGTLIGATQTRSTGTATLSGTGSLTVVNSTLPTGTQFVSYNSLAVAGDTLRTVLTKVPQGKILTLPNGIYEFTDFAQSNYGVLVPANVGGIWGSGTGSVLRMTPNTSTRASAVPTTAGTTNPYRLIGTKTANQLFKNFQLQGTAQGHLYGGLSIAGSSSAPLSGIVVDGVTFNGANPGNSSSPPGETFGLGTNHTDGLQVLNCSFDGRDAGGGYCSSLIGFNSSTNTYVANTTCQYSWYGAGITYWLCDGIHSKNLVSKYNGWGGTGGHGINHENVGGTVLHESPTLFIDLTHGHGKHISLQNSSSQGYVNNPNVSLTNITHDAGVTGGCFMVLIGDSYEGRTQVQTSLPTITKNGITLLGRDASVSTANPDPVTQFFRYH